MASPPSSPTSFVVSSPRRTLSLLKERRGRAAPEVWTSGQAGFAEEHGPKPSEVYGFVGSITTVIVTVIYLVWAYTPEPWLHSMGITYYPSKYWALAVPAFLMVTVVSLMAFYLGLNFMVTPPATSYSTIFGRISLTRLIFLGGKTAGGDDITEELKELALSRQCCTWTTQFNSSPSSVWKKLKANLDECSREPCASSSFVEGQAQPIEPISDIGINKINDLMFGQTI